MRNTLTTLFITLLAWPLAAFAADTADEGPANLTAAFTARVELGEEAPALQLSGRVALTEGKLRISITQDITMEEYVILVDYPADALTMLYPDTLNGQRYKLSAFDHLDGFSRIHGMLRGELPDPPQGWTVSHDDTELDGSPAVHYRAKGPEDKALDWWVRGDHMPVKALLKVAGTNVLIEVTDYDTAAVVDPVLFTVGEGYTITDAGGSVPEHLPSL